MKRLLFLTMYAVSLGAEAQLPDYVPTDGLVAWYGFAGNGFDATGDAPEMLLIGSATFTADRFGTENNALNPNGGSANTDGPFFEYGWGDAFSVSIWFTRPLDTGGNARLISTECPEGNFRIANDAPGQGIIAQMGSYMYVNPLSEAWYHLVYTYDGDATKRVFLNGSLYAEDVEIGFEPHNFCNPLALGRKASSSGSDLWPGDIDDVGIWERGLTEEEILGLYNTVAPIFGCTDTGACNFNEQANVDDGTCLYSPTETLQSLVELSSSSELQVSVPQGLSSWSWSDGVQDSTRTIQPLQEYVLNGFVGEIPEFGEEFEGGLVFAIDTMAQTAFLATNEPVGSGAEWGCKTTTTGAISTAFGSGQTNTQIILEACQESNCAARVAASVGPDWYLPSRDELEAIRVRLHNDGLASYFMNNTYNWYWSSSECVSNGTGATDIQFLDGFVNECNNKDSSPGGVIAVKNSPINICSYTDTLRIELDGDPLCGIGTVWDDISQTCIVANPSDSNFDGCVQLNDLLDLLSAYGDCGAEESPWQCGDLLEYQGYDYETVQIGEQCWFAENLRNELYQNGDSIQANLSDEEWGDTDMDELGATAVFGEPSFLCESFSPEGDGCDDHWSLMAYGRLYNWYALNDSRGLCPSEWNVPSDEEWTIVTDELGGQALAGFVMKTSSGWYNNGNGSNEYGFSALPGGLRNGGNGSFQYAGSKAFFWSATETIDREINYWSNSIERQTSKDLKKGMSIRCIKDTE